MMGVILATDMSKHLKGLATMKEILDEPIESGLAQMLEGSKEKTQQ